MSDRPIRDLPQVTLMVLTLALLTTATAWVMAPFLAATVWATMIVIATWPLLHWFQARLGGRRSIAVALMMVPLLVLLVLPLWLGFWAITNAEVMVLRIQALVSKGLPPLPDWIERIPLAGPQLAKGWGDLAGHPGSVLDRVLPSFEDALRWVVSRAGSLGLAVVELLLTLVISGILYATGEKAAVGVRRFLHRLAGVRGENAAVLAAKAVRAVALGLVVTALAQGAVAGLGLLVVGVPGAWLLTGIAFILCIAQLGPSLVLAPAVIWLYASGASGRGTVLLVFTIVAQTIDNFLKPILIKRGVDLPMLLIIAGVFGGVIGFGVIGLFVGPVILAVAWTLVSSWVDEDLPENHSA
jgi:predicted PurR-regulated permease PerM